MPAPHSEIACADAVRADTDGLSDENACSHTSVTCEWVTECLNDTR